LEKGKSLIGNLGNIKVREGQSIFETAEVQNLREEAGDLFSDLGEDEATQIFLTKAKGVLGDLWAQALLDLGIEGDVSEFLNSGKEIWETVDSDALSQVMSTVLKACLELVLEYIPNLEIPDIYGLYSSPIGDVLYSIGSLRFASFDFDAVNGVQIKLGNPVSLTLDDIGASVQNFSWQYAKEGVYMGGHYLGEGGANLDIKNTTVHMEYGYCYENGRVTLTIQKHSLELRDLEVTVENAGASWLYNLILEILNTRLKEMLERQLLELALGKLNQLAKMLNDMSQGFLNIKLDKSIAVKINEAEAEDPYRTMTMLTDAFKARYGQEPFDVNHVSESTYFTVLPTLPKALLFLPENDGLDPRQLLKISPHVKENMLFGVVPYKEMALRGRFGVPPGEGALYCCARDRRSNLKYEGGLETKAMSQWLSEVSYTERAVNKVTASTCDFFVNHVPPSCPVVLLIGEMQPFYPTVVKSSKDLCFAHCGLEDADEMCQHLKLEGDAVARPRLLVLTQGRGLDPVEYEGTYDDEEAVSAYLSQFMINTKKVVKLTPASVNVFFHKDINKPKVILFSSHLGTPKLYEEMQKKYKKAWFGIVNQDAELQKKFQIGKIPTLMAFPATKSKPVIFQGKISEETINKWIHEFVYPQETE